jgi:hypothetical protein
MLFGPLPSVRLSPHASLQGLPRLTGVAGHDAEKVLDRLGTSVGQSRGNISVNMGSVVDVDGQYTRARRVDERVSQKLKGDHSHTVLYLVHY